MNAYGSSRSFTSSQRSGVDTGAPGRGRTEYTDAIVFPSPFWFASTHPGLVTTVFSKAKRRGVYIDAKMNGEGMTIASVYSVRPRAAAAVSTPLRWEELHERLDPATFSMREVLARVERDGDLHEPLLRGKQRLDRALARLR